MKPFDENLEKARRSEDRLISVLRDQDSEMVTICVRRDDIPKELYREMVTIPTIPTSECDRLTQEIAIIIRGRYYYLINVKEVTDRNKRTGNASISLCYLEWLSRHPEPRVRIACPIENFPQGWGITTATEILQHSEETDFCCSEHMERLLVTGKNVPEICSKISGSVNGTGRPYVSFSMLAYRPLQDLWEDPNREYSREKKLIETIKQVSPEGLRRAFEERHSLHGGIPCRSEAV